MKYGRTSTDNAGNCGVSVKVIGRRGFLAAIAAGVGVIAAGLTHPAHQLKTDAAPDTASNVSDFPARHFISGDDLAG